ncbi:hypothetical protein T02_5685 [Trichinella nativa]|uniref:PiggyBac transposable element-derived protein 4 C-terminal zinc-ribbon domain-containing protein n=1 Tax=Trichinella nativa TaxID=6335 RepID=A0A0V1LN82_9BILA|nr:hypothetical protein T02_5685 [Trichinella nativa]
MKYSLKVLSLVQYFLLLGNSIFLHFRAISNKLKKVVSIRKRAASQPQSLPYTVRKAIEQIGTATSTERSDARKHENYIYRRCVFCGRKRDKKVRSSCIKCRKPCCNEHLRSYCEHCGGSSTSETPLKRIQDG